MSSSNSDVAVIERNDETLIVRFGLCYRFSHEVISGNTLFKCARDGCQGAIILRKRTKPSKEGGIQYKFIAVKSVHCDSLRCSEYMQKLLKHDLSHNNKKLPLNETVYENCLDKSKLLDADEIDTTIREWESIDPADEIQDIFVKLNREFEIISQKFYALYKHDTENINKLAIQMTKILNGKCKEVESLQKVNKVLAERMKTAERDNQSILLNHNMTKDRIDRIIQEKEEQEKLDQRALNEHKDIIQTLKTQIEKISYENNKLREEVYNSEKVDATTYTEPPNSQSAGQINATKGTNKDSGSLNTQEKEKTTQNIGDPGIEESTKLNDSAVILSQIAKAVKQRNMKGQYEKCLNKSGDNGVLENKDAGAGSHKIESKQHVLLIGDDHVKDLAFKSTNFRCPVGFSFSTYHISGKNMNFIVNAIQPEKIKTASTICLVAGMHDVYNTPWKNIEITLNKLQGKCHNKKIVIVLVPPRYDRDNSNYQVVNFNAKLKNFINNMQNTTYLETHSFIQRRHMAKDHIQLNKTGKFVLTVKITQHVQNPNYGKKRVSFKANKTKQSAGASAGKPWIPPRFTRPLSNFMPMDYTSSVLSTNRMSGKPQYSTQQHMAPAHRARESYPPLPVPIHQRTQLTPPVVNTFGNQRFPVEVRRCSCNSAIERKSRMSQVTSTVPSTQLHGRVNVSNPSHGRVAYNNFDNRSYYVTHSSQVFDDHIKNFRLVMTTLV